MKFSAQTEITCGITWIYILSADCPLNQTKAEPIFADWWYLMPGVDQY